MEREHLYEVEAYSEVLFVFGILFFFAHESIELTLIVIFFVGFFVHSIFNMIAATAATDLAKGCHHTRSDSDPNNHNVHPENHKAIATLSGILDGSGSFGAAIGSFVIGAIRRYSWTGMFVFLAWAVFISSMVVLKPWIEDVKRLLYERQTKKNNNILKSLE